MPIRGPQVFEKLQQAQTRIHENVRALERSWNDLDQEMDRLVSQRSKDFLDLARHYLPELSMETVKNSFESVRSELLDLFRNKQQRQAELNSTISQTEQSIREAQIEIEEVTRELNERAEERDRMQADVSARLMLIPTYKQLTNEAAQAELRLTTNESRMEQLEQEARENLPSFDNSRLFQYLHQRRFGTPDYQARGWTRRIDRWLARYIDYSKAKRNYEFLKTTPELMSAELQRRRDQFNALMEKIEAMEAEVEKKVGLTEVISLGDQLGERRDGLLLVIEEQGPRLKEFGAELDALQKSNGQFYEGALLKMRRHLQESEEAALQQRAEKTANPQDDRIVDEILNLNTLIEELEPRIAQLNVQRKSLMNKRLGLDEIVNRFRSSNFDSKRSVFSDDPGIGMAVDQFLNDKLDQHSLWNLIRQRQEFQASWAQENSIDVLSDPSAQIVLHTMFDLATKALKNSARRSVHRRGSSGSGGFSWPSAPARPSSHSSRPRSRGSGFTTGNGF